MRCPSCGTENEPDSRFCGGCGARLSGTESRVAPTQKIETGAQPVQPMPPPVASRTSSAPHAARPSGPAAVPSPPRPARASTAPSLAPPPGRRGGLIAVLVIVDLALAGAGAYLLREGLADAAPATPAASPAPIPGPRVEPIEPAKVEPIGSAASAAAPRAAPEPEPTPRAAAPEPAPAPAKVTKARAKPVAKKAAKARRQKTSQPLDPYADVPVHYFYDPDAEDEPPGQRLAPPADRPSP